MIRNLLMELARGWEFYVIHYNFAETIERFKQWRIAHRTMVDHFTG